MIKQNIYAVLVVTGNSWSEGLVMAVVWCPRRYTVLCSRSWTPSVRQPDAAVCVCECVTDRCMSIQAQDDSPDRERTESGNRPECGAF
jgi:hypothetical protein